jgi:hypothetical protein
MLFENKMTYLIMRACNICKAVWKVLARHANIRQAVWKVLARLADTHQTFWQVLAKLADIRQWPFLEKNVTCLAKFVRVMSESGKWCASGHFLVRAQATAIYMLILNHT